MKRITFSVGQGKTKAGLTIQNVSHKRTLAYLRVSQVYGGYTAKVCSGGWVSTDGELIEENSLVIEAVTDIGTDHEVVAGYLRDLFEQSCVLMTVEDLETVKFV